MNIAISVLVNIFKTCGSTISARRIAKIFKDRHTIVFVTRANKKQKLKCLGDRDIFVVKPDKTKLYNLKLIPIVMRNKFNIMRMFMEE